MSTFTEEMFICPITHEHIKTAVVDREGNTYEKSAIEEWLKKNNTSPLTRTVLTMNDLSPNRALQTMIDACRDEGSKPTDHTHQEFKFDAVMKMVDDMAIVVVRAHSTGLTSPRPPLDIVLCLDNSGSMCATTTFQQEGGEMEKSDLSILDIVKHGAKTVIKTLGPEDKVSIVKYSSNATVLCPLTFCSPSGKALLLAALDGIDTEGSTNIWDGLHKSMEELRRASYDERIPYVMLMTDGVPNVSPPRGHIAMLERYFDSHKNFSCVVNTYGFGESLDSELLDNIANVRHGSYCYIPDSGFVGTIFVNSIAHMKTVSLTNAGINLEFDEKFYECSLVDNADENRVDCSNFSHLKIGNISDDQDRSFIFKLKIKEDSALRPAPVATMHALDRHLKKGIIVSAGPTKTVEKMPLEGYRHMFYQLINEAIDGSTHSNLEEWALSLAKDYPDSKYAEALLQDWEGQVKMGLSDKYLHKWGKHFLRSLARAHKNQQCLNFKDPGVQFYGGDIFKGFRDEADDIFNAMPVPTPAFFEYRSAPALAPPTMLSYNYGGGGCFDGEGMVRTAEKLEGGEHCQIPVKKLKRGDVVMSKYRVLDCSIEIPKKVACIVRTKIDDTVDMVDVNGVLLTPWHPIFHNGDWKFPAKIGAETRHDIDYIYNVVLEDNGHCIFINDVECITLGHGLTHHDVVDHDYFGEKVLVDLKCSDGWEKGLVEIDQSDWTRGADGRVNGLGDKFTL